MLIDWSIANLNRSRIAVAPKFILVPDIKKGFWTTGLEKTKLYVPAILPTVAF